MPPYTEDQIKRYLEILHNYTKPKEEKEDEIVASKKAKCCNCPNSERFTIHFGQKICDECGVANGHVLGFFDVRDYDRLHFRKKSIYQRRYYYEKKVNQVSKRLHLTDEQRYELYNKLNAIDNNVMEILNKRFCRKRMISIFYLIKKLLEEMGGEYSKVSKLVYLKISPQTLENYEKWWASYKSLNNGLSHTSVEKPVNNPS